MNQEGLRLMSRIIDAVANGWKRVFEQYIESKYIEEIKKIAKTPDKSTLYIDWGDLSTYLRDIDGGVVSLSSEYYRFEPCFVQAFYNVAHKIEPLWTKGRSLFISIYNMSNEIMLRELKPSRNGELLKFKATVTRCSTVRPELYRGSFKCNTCGTQSVPVQQQFKYTEPYRCENSCCGNRSDWILDTDGPDSSVFVDWQTLQVQECASDLLAGQVPRNLRIILRNDMVDMVKPGDKCIFTGYLSVVPDVAQLKKPKLSENMRSSKSAKGIKRTKKSDIDYGVTGLKETSIRDLTYKLVFIANCVYREGSILRVSCETERSHQSSLCDDLLNTFTEEERREISIMSRDNNLYENITQSIAPTIFGYDDVKRGMLLMLLGGVSKKTSDGIAVRGDINVGDPSAAKSQFLKYVCSFADRAVYTSGKASSAAGLTAAVVRDTETGETTIQPGALMLADKGICCIDEFDKMNPKDQVAIHEAMEQQTVSITKAGINVTLNTRASVLAAANPLGGRYDKSKSLKHNLNMSDPILSRFDLLFVIFDETDEEKDRMIAEHIVKLRQNGLNSLRIPYSEKQVKAYLKFAKWGKPQISKEAAQEIETQYISMRKENADNKSHRMTVRQLESIIRLSEAYAKLDFKDFVEVMHVKEAARLLQTTILRMGSEFVYVNDARSSEENEGKHRTERVKSVMRKSVLRPIAKVIKQLLYCYNQHFDGGLPSKDIVKWYLDTLNPSYNITESIVKCAIRWLIESDQCQTTRSAKRSNKAKEAKKAKKANEAKEANEAKKSEEEEEEEATEEEEAKASSLSRRGKKAKKDNLESEENKVGRETREENEESEELISIIDKKEPKCLSSAEEPEYLSSAEEKAISTYIGALIIEN